MVRFFISTQFHNENSRFGSFAVPALCGWNIWVKFDEGYVHVDEIVSTICYRKIQSFSTSKGKSLEFARLKVVLFIVCLFAYQNFIINAF